MATKPKTPARNLRHALTVRAAAWAGWLVPRLPYAAVWRAGACLGSMAWHLGGARRERTLGQVREAFPALGEPARRRLAIESFRMSGRVFAESLWIPAMTREWFDRHWVVENPDVLDAVLRLGEKRGVVILTGHTGNWEVALQFCQDRFGRDVMAVAAEPSIEALAPPMKALRESHGARIVWRGQAALPLLRHLRRGGCAAMLVDHNLRGEGVEVPFFGRPAHTLLAPARLALQSGAVLTTSFSFLRPDGRYGLHVDSPFGDGALPREPEVRLAREVALTAEYTRRVEEFVRRHPGQWTWMHRRWQRRRRHSLYWSDREQAPAPVRETLCSLTPRMEAARS
ncbi:hypothetical protein HZA57_08980 [Candidatus Poribacteria bacterium]|nr:hypothetical protein [Candidatus Poribacteria bacterium]